MLQGHKVTVVILLPGLGVFPGDGSEESLSARALPRAIAAWSFADAASSSSNVVGRLGATFADDRREAALHRKRNYSVIGLFWAPSDGASAGASVLGRRPSQGPFKHA